MAKKKTDVNIPETMPDAAEEELQSHFREPSYTVKYEDGTEVNFNLGDIVTLYTVMEDDEKIYMVGLISGSEFEISAEYYADLKDIKRWNNSANDGKYHLDEKN